MGHLDSAMRPAVIELAFNKMRGTRLELAVSALARQRVASYTTPANNTFYLTTVLAVILAKRAFYA